MPAATASRPASGNTGRSRPASRARIASPAPESQVRSIRTEAGWPASRRRSWSSSCAGSGTGPASSRRSRSASAFESLRRRATCSASRPISAASRSSASGGAPACSSASIGAGSAPGRIASRTPVRCIRRRIGDGDGPASSRSSSDQMRSADSGARQDRRAAIADSACASGAPSPYRAWKRKKRRMRSPSSSILRSGSPTKRTRPAARSDRPSKKSCSVPSCDSDMALMVKSRRAASLRQSSVQATVAWRPSVSTSWRSVVISNGRPSITAVTVPCARPVGTTRIAAARSRASTVSGGSGVARSMSETGRPDSRSRTTPPTSLASGRADQIASSAASTPSRATGPANGPAIGPGIIPGGPRTPPGPGRSERTCSGSRRPGSADRGGCLRPPAPPARNTLPSPPWPGSDARHRPAER